MRRCPSFDFVFRLSDIAVSNNRNTVSDFTNSIKRFSSSTYIGNHLNLPFCTPFLTFVFSSQLLTSRFSKMKSFQVACLVLGTIAGVCADPRPFQIPPPLKRILNDGKQATPNVHSLPLLQFNGRKCLYLP
jgi:hypothetical protein